MSPSRTVAEVTGAFEDAGYPLSMGCGLDRSFKINDFGKHVNVRFNDRFWLTMDALLKSRKKSFKGHKSWSLLCLNSKIKGPARFVRRKDSSYGIRVDIVIPDSSEELSCLIRSAVDSIKSALDVYRSSKGIVDTLRPLKPAQSEAVQGVFEEAGWHFVTHNSLCSVPLKVPDRLYHAHVQESPDRGFLVSVVLTDVKDYKNMSRQSLSNMLLLFSDNIRMTRPTSYVNSEGAHVAVFEAFLKNDFSTRELDFALSSLSVACQIIGDEVNLMSSERIAKEYYQLTFGQQKQKKEEGVKDHEYINT